MKQIFIQDNLFAKMKNLKLVMYLFRYESVSLLKWYYLKPDDNGHGYLNKKKQVLPKIILVICLSFNQSMVQCQIPAVRGNQSIPVLSPIIDADLKSNTFAERFNTDGLVSQSFKNYSTPFLPEGNYASAKEGIDLEVHKEVKKKITTLQFINHKVSATDNIAKLYWEVPDEKNGIMYIIERSFDGRKFTEIGSVVVELTGKGFYNFADTSVKNILLANFYYRIRLVEMSGNEKLSYIMLLRMGNADFIRLTGKFSRVHNMDIIKLKVKKPSGTRFYILNPEENNFLTQKITLTIRQNIFLLNELNKFSQHNYFV